MNLGRKLDEKEKQEFITEKTQDPVFVDQFLTGMLAQAGRDLLITEGRQDKQAELAKDILRAIEPVVQPQLDAHTINPGHLVLALEFLQHEIAKQVLREGTVEITVEEEAENGVGSKEVVN